MAHEALAGRVETTFDVVAAGHVAAGVIEASFDVFHGNASIRLPQTCRAYGQGGFLNVDELDGREEFEFEEPM